MFLRKIRFEDNENIVRWRNQPFVVQNFLDKRPLTIETHNNWFRNRVQTGEVCQFIIVLDSGEEIGTTYLRDIDPVNRKAEFGLFIGEEWALGKGYGYQAIRMTCQYGFEELNLHKIYMRVLPANKASVGACSKAGFAVEGIAKSDILCGTEYLDVQFMAMFNPAENVKPDEVSLNSPVC